MRILHWSLCLVLSTISYLAQADVTQLDATIDKNPMLVDESISLQVVAIGGADRDAIDFSELTSDFRVGQPSVSQSTQIINFDRTTSTTWTLQLLPRRTGVITIPSFTIDGVSSKAIELTVLPAGQGTRSQPRDFYVTTSLEQDTVYLQQQVQYQVKIYLSGDIQRGSLSEPVLTGSVIEQLGEDKEYQELVNGVRYRVIERTFAVLPQSSGTYTIDGPVFQAEVLTNTRQSFAYFNRSKTISRMAPPQNLTVLPIPENYQYTWLPSEQVQLDEQWQGINGNEFVQGEPITRTVTLTALGLIEEQLPAIDAQYHPSFKTYPEQAEKATVKQNNRLIAQLVQNTAVIPSEPGNYVLPEIKVPWFDVNSQETRFAVLPAKSVMVVAPTTQSASTNAELGTNDASEFNSEESSDNNQDNAANTGDSLFPIVIFGLDALHIILSVMILILIILMLIMAKRPRTTEFVRTPENDAPINDEYQAWLALGKSIDGHDLPGMQQHLRAWLSLSTGRTVQSVNNTLLSLRADDAAEAFNQALASQYSSASNSYSADKLKQGLSALRARQQDRRELHSHTNMYPIS